MVKKSVEHMSVGERERTARRRLKAKGMTPAQIDAYLTNEIIPFEREERLAAVEKVKTLTTSVQKNMYFDDLLFKQQRQPEDIFDVFYEGGVPFSEIQKMTPGLKSRELSKEQKEEIVNLLKTNDADKIKQHLQEMKGRGFHTAVSSMEKHLLEEKLEKEKQIQEMDIQQKELGDLISWFSLPLEKVKIQRNDHTRIHKLIDAAKARNLYDSTGKAVPMSERSENAQVFVVKHDWSGALGPAIEGASSQFERANATGPAGEEKLLPILRQIPGEGELKMPYPDCFFEFMVQGRCIVLLISQQELSGATFIAVTTFIEASDKWFTLALDQVDEFPVYEFLWKQILAIAIALDSKVAETDVVKADTALNKKRLKNNKSLLKDYLVVDLSKRHKRASSGGSQEYLGKVRLHFRRGHWRRYDTEKKWINWMLVGNPDLGFVDKHYRL